MVAFVAIATAACGIAYAATGDRLKSPVLIGQGQAVSYSLGFDTGNGTSNATIKEFQPNANLGVVIGNSSPSYASGAAMFVSASTYSPVFGIERTGSVTGSFTIDPANNTLAIRNATSSTTDLSLSDTTATFAGALKSTYSAVATALASTVPAANLQNGANSAFFGPSASTSLGLLGTYSGIPVVGGGFYVDSSAQLRGTGVWPSMVGFTNTNGEVQIFGSSSSVGLNSTWTPTLVAQFGGTANIFYEPTTVYNSVMTVESASSSAAPQINLAQTATSGNVAIKGGTTTTSPSILTTDSSNLYFGTNNNDLGYFDSTNLNLTNGLQTAGGQVVKFQVVQGNLAAGATASASIIGNILSVAGWTEVPGPYYTPLTADSTCLGDEDCVYILSSSSTSSLVTVKNAKPFGYSDLSLRNHLPVTNRRSKP
jgi:hypothetical protein